MHTAPSLLREIQRARERVERSEKICERDSFVTFSGILLLTPFGMSMTLT